MKTNKDQAPKRPEGTREEQARPPKTDRPREDIAQKNRESHEVPDEDQEIIEHTSWERPQTDEDMDRVL